MAFPASTNTLDFALTSVRESAAKLKKHTQTMIDRSAAGSTPRRNYVNLLRFINEAIATWDSAAATPGLVVYAQEQFDDVGLDIIVEYNTMKTAAQDLASWIFTNLPTDGGSGAALLEIVNIDGTQINLNFTIAQTALFRTEAAILVVAID